MGGSQSISGNLKHQLAKTEPTLKHVLVRCPRLKDYYPIRCTLTGLSAIAGKSVAVNGKLTVNGVDLQSHTYVYQVAYAPTRHH